MNHEKLYQIIREAQPDKCWDTCIECPYFGKVEYSLADVMIALKNGNILFYMDIHGYIYKGNIELENFTGYIWDLTKPLSGQSEPLLKWLEDLFLEVK